MAVLNIRKYPDPVLRQENVKVEEFDDELRRLVSDMFETMRAANGVGIAGPQVGVNKRLLVIEYDGEKYVLINPEIKDSEGRASHEEGCLSFPGLYVTVESPEEMTVEYRDEFGKKHIKHTDGFLTTIFSHELDHLNGRLLIDRVSPMKRAFLKTKIAKNKGK